MKIINTNKAPGAVGPYVQGIQIENGTLYLSGQLGLDYKTMKMPETIEEQTVNSLKNIEQILNEAGYKKENIIKTLVLLDDINDFAKVNVIYSDFFGNHKPARSAFQVGALPLKGKIEIEVIAYK
ncbi:Rid family detoxifying hydrolase [Mesoplasma photuris]|uniref:Rid family detoxifying hydrolase n=1 Tax=Mesoplasma photuris TaxID=217731 RepID=UPI0004E201C5|nr:Rid family detoxifying hydrolase [Mesoplasma photuris]